MTEASTSSPAADEQHDTQAAPPAPPLPPPRAQVDRGKLVAFAAMGGLIGVGLVLIATSPRHDAAPPSLALTNGEVADPAIAATTKIAAVADAATPVPSAAPERPRPPPAWRVASLKVDANVEVVEGTFGKGGFVQTLTNAGVPRAEIKRVAHAFENVHRVDHPAPTDTFVVAKDKAKGVVVAFEYASSPLDVWQAKVDESSSDKHLAAHKLDLFVEHRRVASALVIGADPSKVGAGSGLRQEIIDAIDDALEGHIEGGLQGGARLRIAASEDWVEGTFVRARVDAIELIPKTGSPLRIYYYERDKDAETKRRNAPLPGFYDTKGRQPYKGAFRTPLPLARVTSRYNPKRLHPVLKVVTPHNGVDYGASTGTPVYASAAGTVTVAGNSGPCGNMVELQHAGNITTGYCHLSRFAAGLRPGQKVEARQLVGYVGQTGRVTGPHLHFAVKRGGVFIDPLTLKMDGVRVLPPSDRDSFAHKRADLDAIIDGVALPSAADVPDESDDKDLHAE